MMHNDATLPRHQNLVSGRHDVIDERAARDYRRIVRELGAIGRGRGAGSRRAIERSAALITLARRIGIEPSELLGLVSSPERTADRFIGIVNQESPRHAGR